MAKSNNELLKVPTSGAALITNPQEVAKAFARINLLSNPQIAIVRPKGNGNPDGSELIIAGAVASLNLSLRFPTVVSPLSATPTNAEIATAFNQLLARLAEIGVNV